MNASNLSFARFVIYNDLTRNIHLDEKSFASRDRYLFFLKFPWRDTLLCGIKKGLREARSTARLTTCPDLRRLTRRVLQVAELLPWPVKDRLFQDLITPYGARVCGNQVFWRGQS